MTDDRPRRHGSMLVQTIQGRLAAPASILAPTALAVVILACLLTSGCTEFSAGPTGPEPYADDSGWQGLYPALSAQTLRAAWGLHAAAMWAVGDQGTILHYDGQRVRSFPSPTPDDLTAIDGLALDDVWAVARRGEILRWTGRAWLLAHTLPDAMLNTICTSAADEVLVGGTRLAAGVWQSAIWRHDGRSWRLSPLQAGSEAQPTQPVQRIWDPGPGLPIMAATLDKLYALADQSWHESPNNPNRAVVLGADRGIILYEDQWSRLLLGSINPDGSLSFDCQINLNPGFQHLVQSWHPLSTVSNHVVSVHYCMTRTVHTSSYAIGGLAVPAVPGPHGACFFVFGQDAGLTRLVWQPDHTVVATELTPEPSSRLIDQIAGDGRRLVTLDWQGRLLGHEAGQWQVIPTPWPALGLDSLDDGTLVLRNRDQQIALDDGKGGWLQVPDCPVDIHALWLDSSRRARVKSFNQGSRIWELWGLEQPSGWTLLDTLSYAYGLVDQFTGFAPDDLYLLCAKNDIRWLLHHDGTRWREVFGEVVPERDITIERIAAGRHSGRLYLEGVDAELGAFSGCLRHGVITVLNNAPLGWDELGEVTAGQAICRAASTLLELGPHGWTVIPGPARAGAALRRHWAHADQGLFVITDRDEIVHRDLARGTP